MLAVLALTFPFFALVLCGYAAARTGALPLAAIAGLNSFVLYFALPAMLYRFGASMPLAQLLDPAAAGVYALAALLLGALAVAQARRRALGWSDAAFGALVTVFPNSGFMGLPLLVALLGPHSAGPVMLTMALDMVVTTSACIALSRRGSGGEGTGAGPGAALWQALRAMGHNPLPWAIGLGALASAFSLRLPGPLEQTLAMLGAAASPVALFAIGAVLARSQMNLHDRVSPLDYVPLALAKLALHPLLLWLLGQGAIALGLGLSNSTLQVLVLTAALPSASNVVLLVERYGAGAGRVARIILVSTALAFGSFSLAVALWG